MGCRYQMGPLHRVMVEKAFCSFFELVGEARVRRVILRAEMSKRKSEAKG